MNLGLPHLDGFAATEQILAHQDVAVAALTGRSDSVSLDRAARAGAVDHVLKPFSDGKLVATLSHVLAERHATGALRRHPWACGFEFGVDLTFAGISRMGREG